MWSANKICDEGACKVLSQGIKCSVGLQTLILSGTVARLCKVTVAHSLSIITIINTPTDNAIGKVGARAFEAAVKSCAEVQELDFGCESTCHALPCTAMHTVPQAPDLTVCCNYTTPHHTTQTTPWKSQERLSLRLP